MKKINIIASISIICCSMITHLNTMQPTSTEQASVSALNGLRPDKNEEKFDEIMALSKQISRSLHEMQDRAQRLTNAIDRLHEQEIDQTDDLHTRISASCSAIISKTHDLQQALRDNDDLK